MCSLAGVAVGFGLSTAAMQAASDAQRAVVITDVRPSIDPVSADTPWLGLRFHTVSTGVVVEQVYAATPAEAVGVQAGDVIVAYDRVPIHSSNDLFRMVRGSAIGERPILSMLRHGHALEVQPTLSPVPVQLR
ncbi:MAG TPA: PDZ domain-containing protein [Kofleriaceae bacterium]|nr:PDZ domain-containing protein [Kofleriaceae bacterium]